MLCGRRPHNMKEKRVLRGHLVLRQGNPLHPFPESALANLVGHEVLPEEVHALAQGGMFWLTQVRVALPEFRGQGTG